VNVSPHFPGSTTGMPRLSATAHSLALVTTLPIKGRGCRLYDTPQNPFLARSTDAFGWRRSRSKIPAGGWRLHSGPTVPGASSIRRTNWCAATNRTVRILIVALQTGL